MKISDAIGDLIYEHPVEMAIFGMIVLSQAGFWIAVIVHGWPHG